MECFIKFERKQILPWASLKGAQGMVHSLLEEGFCSLTMQALGRDKPFLLPSQSPVWTGSKRVVHWLVVQSACWIREFAGRGGAFQLCAERHLPASTPSFNQPIEQLTSAPPASTLSRLETDLGAEVACPAQEPASSKNRIPLQANYEPCPGPPSMSFWMVLKLGSIQSETQMAIRRCFCVTGQA